MSSDGLRRAGGFSFEFVAFLRGHRGELPEVVAKDAPFDSGFTVCEAFASKGLSEIGVLEDPDAGFGSAASFLQQAEGCIFELFLEQGHGARADGVDEAEIFEIAGVGGGIETAVAGVAAGETMVPGNAFKAGLDERAVGLGLVLHEIPVDDEPVGLLGEIEPIAELDLGSGLAAHKNMDVRLVEAQDLFGIGGAAFADDALVGLVDGLG